MSKFGGDMLGSHLLAGCLILAGVLGELAGSPAYLQSPMPPSMDVTLLLLAQFLSGGPLVFWAGCLGLSEDLIRGGLPGPGTFCFATAALAAACMQNQEECRLSQIDRLITGLGMLMVLWGLRKLADLSLSFPAVGALNWGLDLHRTAVTFLAFVAISLVINGLSLWRRRERLG